jgi:uncharacterized protein YbjT (DUF2867 family)
MKIAVAGATGRVGRHVVDVLTERGHEVVPMSRATGVDVITGDGLAEALEGVECVIDVATGPSPEQAAATEFFTTSARNLHEYGLRAGVQRIVEVSIVGTDNFSGGYGAAKIAHERAMLSGPIPVSIVRATQFHEFVEQLMQWGRQGEVVYVPTMRTQPIAARSVAEALADEAENPTGSLVNIAGPHEETLVELAKLFAAQRGDDVRIEAVNPSDPDSALNESGGLLPGPDARIAGPAFKEWLDATF